MSPAARPQTPFGQVLVAGLVAGAIAGAAAGLVDALWSVREASQFVPTLGTKLRFLVYIAATYGLAGSLLGVAAAAVGAGFWRGTRLGDLGQAAMAAHRETRARDPREALIGLSLALAGVPALGAALTLGYLYALHSLAERKHVGLIIASAMGLSLIAVLAAAAATLLLARPIELGLRAAAKNPRLGRLLSAPLAPAVAAVTLLATGGALAAARTWETLRLLHLRPAWVLLLAAAMAVGAAGIGRRVARALERRRLAARCSAVVALPVLLAVILLATGNADGPRKAATRYSGLGGPFTRAFQKLGDFDHDGFSRILGGGDCDDGNPDVHPGAVEIPDDGIDQNCIGGDATLHPASDDVGFAPVPPSVPADFDVVLITIDTLRADHLGAYGYHRPTSRNLDALAHQGALFLNAWAHAPSTRYSMPAILTGRLPLDVRYDYSIRGWPGLSMDNTTIAEILKRRGFATEGVLNYWYFSPERHLDQGFDHYDNRNQRLHKGIPGKGPAETHGSSSRQQTDTALQMVDSVGAQQRFFLWIHYYDPHYDYEKHPGFDFGDEPMDLYDSEIAFTDQQIGRLFDGLRARGVWGKTVVVVTGDHGEGFGEHGIDLHGYHLYRAQTKVPLIIRVPGLAPRTITAPVGHTDILPTLANLAGAKPTTDMMGRSLVDLLDGAAPGDRDRVIFQQLSYENNNEMRAAVSQRCHVIFNVSPQTSWEVYRIDRDPQETRDVSATDACADTRHALEAWYDSSQIPAGATEALLPGPPTIATPLDVDFGDEVRLLSADLPRQPVHPGDSFPMTLTFQARGRLHGDWKVFAHFEQGGHRFMGDHEPARPFAWWKAGQYIRDTHQVHVPANIPPGTYRLWMGLFRGADRRPARAPSARVVDDRVLVGSVEIRR